MIRKHAVANCTYMVVAELYFLYPTMFRVILFSAFCLSLLGCAPANESALFSGRVASFYYLDEKDSIQGITRSDQGRSGTSTRVNEDIYVEVYSGYVIVKLLNRNESAYIIPRERVRTIVVGTQEANELNIPE